MGKVSELDFEKVGAFNPDALAWHLYGEEEEQAEVGQKRRTLREQVGGSKRSKTGMDEFANVGAPMLAYIGAEARTKANNIKGNNDTLKECGLTGKAKSYVESFLGAPVSRTTLQTMITHNVVLPVSFLLARPRMTYNMGTAILMKG